MKALLFVALFAANFAYAQDMSGTETWAQSRRDNADGSSSYVGGCTLHEDFEGEKFTVGRTIVPYFAPEFRDTEEQILAKLTKVDPVLLAKVRAHVGEGFPFVDDITVEKLKSIVFPKLNLFRFNIGVGGGNGMYLIFSKTRTGYELLSDTFDGDLNYCDRQVWQN